LINYSIFFCAFSCTNVSTYCDVPFVPTGIFVDVLCLALVFAILVLLSICYFGRLLSNYSILMKPTQYAAKDFADILDTRHKFTGYQAD